MTKQIKNVILGVIVLCIALCLAGCGQTAVEKDSATALAANQTSNETLFDRWMSLIMPQKVYQKSEQSSIAAVEDMSSLYTDDVTPLVLYLTARKGNASEGTNHTWNELHQHDLSWYEEQDEDVFRCEALVQFGDEVGPVYGYYGYGDSSANATIRLSGKRSSVRQQKSYRVDLDANGGNISGMKAFVLQKSFTDPFRFTDKLAFDLIARCDTLLSTRTSFVHLYVRDLTADQDTQFMDYGLYTMVEPINKRYLKNRNLDSSGELYKVVDFDFARHADVIMQPTDSGYSAARFEEMLESKGSNDYSGLIAMLDALNDETIPIQDVVEAYFDKDSLYSWLAINLLLDNKDTDTENFYLYRPMGDEHFYIIPWDFDGSLRRDYEKLRDPDYVPGWEQGIFLYTQSKLFGRMMRSEYCTNELSETITVLHDDVFSGKVVQSRAEVLSEIVPQYLYDMPDMAYARVTEANYEKLLKRIAEQVDENFYTYYDTLETPWPFHILEPEQDGGHVVLRWEESQALNQEVTYAVELDDSWDFKDSILNETNYSGTSLDAGILPPGEYFLRVTAKSESGHTQEAYEFYNTEKKSTVRGVLCFYVKEGDDG